VIADLLLDIGLVVALIGGVVGLQRFSNRVRLVFDLACFCAISAFLFKQGISPLLPSDNTLADGPAMWHRLVAGAWWVLGARVLVAVLRFTVRAGRQSRQARLSSDVLAAIVYIAAGVVVFKSVFLLPVSGVLATSGVLAIVIGLALQNTLGDVFAGIAVDVESPFKIGDRILLGDKIEGQVIQVNWRSIWVQTDGDDVAIIPNSTVAKSDIINRSYPTERRAASVQVSCPTRAAPARVLECVLNATLLCPAILRNPGPSAVMTEFGAKTSLYSVSFYVADTRTLSATKGLLLQYSHRQLYYAGLLADARGPRLKSTAPDQPLSPAQRLLHDLTLFEALERPQVDELARQATEVFLESGEVLFKQAAADATLYFIASGIVRMDRVTSPGSSTELLGYLGAGEYIGEIGLFTGAPHAATATALTPCRIHRLSREAIAPLLATNADLAAAFDKSVRRGLSILHRDVAMRATEDIGGGGQLLQRIRQFFSRNTSA
jgi:small-conductance mechanosensitive channel/CRP-like cAMP-binding protein